MMGIAEKIVESLGIDPNAIQADIERGQQEIVERLDSLIKIEREQLQMLKAIRKALMKS